MISATGHRLPHDVVPSNYRLHIDSDLEASTFHGSVEITVDIVEPTAHIICNCAHLEILDTTLTVGPVDAGRSMPVSAQLDPDRELLKLIANETLPCGPATIRVEFRGALNSQLVGYYRSEFSVDGRSEVMAVTQFEAPYARWAFPCWDEPEFKASFEISLTCAEGLTAVSNANEVGRTHHDDGRVTFRFAPTMKMSTYLVAWVVGDLEISEPVTAGSTQVRVAHRPGVAALSSFALECAAHAVAWFEDYYAIAYPGEKLDLIAVPDFAFGAMENLGCVTFRETLLLLDPSHASRSETERAATVIEHEIAHMWFGDLVTMQWWDGIWLNEAFATFMEISCADDYRPDWSIWTSFSLMRSAAFDTDALANTRPIEFEVETPADAEAMFDVLTYEKGAAVLRMFEQWATPEAFRNGVRSYLGRHAYGNTETGDLWRSLSEASGVDVADILDRWIHHGGHPLISVELLDTTLVLSQRRFAYAGGDPVPETIWTVPMRIAVSRAGTIEHHTMILNDQSATIEVGDAIDFVSINFGATGFYRSDYAPTLRSSLMANLAELTPIDRYGLLDDSWALFLAARVDFDDLTETLRGVAAVESNSSVWRLIASICGNLLLLAHPEDRHVVRTLVDDLTAPVIDVHSPFEAGPHGTSEVGDLQAIVARLAGTIADRADVVEAARRHFDRRQRTHDEFVGPDLDAAAIEIVACHAGPTEFDRLIELSQHGDTPQEELRALNALARFRDPILIERLCERCATVVRTQNAPYTLASAMANPEHGAQVWRFVERHWEELLSRFPSSSHDRLIGGVRAFADRTLVDEVTEFLAAHPIRKADLPLRQHLERARVNVAARERLSAQLRSRSKIGQE